MSILTDTPATGCRFFCKRMEFILHVCAWSRSIGDSPQSHSVFLLINFAFASCNELLCCLLWAFVISRINEDPSYTFCTPVYFKKFWFSGVEMCQNGRWCNALFSNPQIVEWGQATMPSVECLWKSNCGTISAEVWYALQSIVCCCYKILWGRCKNVNPS